MSRYWARVGSSMTTTPGGSPPVMGGTCPVGGPEHEARLIRPAAATSEGRIVGLRIGSVLLFVPRIAMARTGIAREFSMIHGASMTSSPWWAGFRGRLAIGGRLRLRRGPAGRVHPALAVGEQPEPQEVRVAGDVHIGPVLGQ